MLTLAIESTAVTASAALVRNGELIGEYTLNSAGTHSATLLPMAEDILKKSNTDIDDIDLFACAAGPGSFTGVRIGAALIKGLAFAGEKPCVGVSSLEALAYNLSAHVGIICPVMNARRGQVYTAIFSSDGSGNIQRLMADSAIPTEELYPQLDLYKNDGLDIRFVGDGYSITESYGAKPTPQRLRWQSAASVAAVAERIYGETEDKSAFAPELLLPVYLRLPQAQREREERLKNQNQQV